VGSWEEADATPGFEEGMKEDLGSYGLVGLTSSLREMMERITLQSISKCVKHKKVIGSSQRGFMKGKLCLTSLIASCSETTSLS